MGIKRMTLQEFEERIATRYAPFTLSKSVGVQRTEVQSLPELYWHGDFECMPLGPRTVVCPGCRADAVREEGLASIKLRAFELFGERIKIVEDTYVNSGSKATSFASSTEDQPSRLEPYSSTRKAAPSTVASVVQM